MSNDFAWGAVAVATAWALVELWRRWQKQRADERWMAAAVQATTKRKKRARRK